MLKRTCEECGSVLHKNKTRELVDGTTSTQYRCPDGCGYVTFHEEDKIKDRPYAGPKILIFDIETAPIRAFVWRIWKENVGLNQIDRDWYVMSWVAKWAYCEDILTDSLPNHEDNYKKDVEDDSAILKTIWNLLDEADMVVAHNGDRFDIPKLNARFIYHGMKPPSPYKQIDTLKVAKYTFNFTSNKLDYLANYLGFGKKADTGGFSLWSGCMDGDPESWAKMVDYNKKDVVLLEDVYMVMRPWMKNHPNFGVYLESDESMCTACGCTNLISLTDREDKYAYTNLGRFELFRCVGCGRHIRGRKCLLDKRKKKGLVTNAL